MFAGLMSRCTIPLACDAASASATCVLMSSSCSVCIGLSGNALLQALALQLLHHDEGMAVVILNAVDGADVGMVQQRSRPCFPLEALQRLGIAGQIFRNKLQRNVPPQLEIFGLVNHTHATAPELAQDAIVGDCLANHEKTEALERGNVRLCQPLRSTGTVLSGAVKLAI